MQLIKERSFQGLLGSGIITMEGWHCFERDNTREGAGRKAIARSLRKWQMTCRSQFLNSSLSSTFSSKTKKAFLELFLFFYFLRSIFFYIERCRWKALMEKASVKYSLHSIDNIYLLASRYSFSTSQPCVFLPISWAKSTFSDLPQCNKKKWEPYWVNKRPGTQRDIKKLYLMCKWNPLLGVDLFI